MLNDFFPIFKISINLFQFNKVTIGFYVFVFQQSPSMFILWSLGLLDELIRDLHPAVATMV